METAHFESLYPENSREKEIKQILTCIKSGNFNQTISLPGGGRSQILRLLAYNRALRAKHLGEKEKLFHFVLCNFSEVRNKPLHHALKFLLLSTMQSLAAIGLQKILHTFKEDEVVIFNHLKTLIGHLTLEENMNIVFLFDNFDEYLPMVSPDFFKDLKILRNTAIYKFSVVFAVGRPLEETLDQEVIADIYQFIADHKVYLSLYDKPSLEFRVNSVEKAFGKTIKKDHLEKIIDLTGAHVNLTRLCVEILLESNIDLSSFWGVPPKPWRRGATPESVFRDSGRASAASDTASLARMTNLESDSKGAAFLLRHKSIQGALLDIWNSLTPAEQNVLKAPPTSEVERVYLENIGLLSRGARSGLARKNGKITIKLLAEFIKQKPQASQNITFDVNTNEIKKGNFPLSDKLTSFEFRLLKYLLENTNRIVDREEIISVIWSSEKSTAGVTDQALDQLVFRVRHKIENDPNKPSHLQTVKGRGFKFSPASTSEESSSATPEERTKELACLTGVETERAPRR